jgi:hypothetical protein
MGQKFHEGPIFSAKVYERSMKSSLTWRSWSRWTMQQAEWLSEQRFARPTPSSSPDRNTFKCAGDDQALTFGRKQTKRNADLGEDKRKLTNLRQTGWAPWRLPERGSQWIWSQNQSSQRVRRLPLKKTKILSKEHKPCSWSSSATAEKGVSLKPGWREILGLEASSTRV